MTPPEPSTGVPASAARRPRWAQKVERVQRESQHDDGWLMAVELVTATLTWGGIGYLVDRFVFHTYPVLMSIGFVVGFFAGMYLLWLKTSKMPDAPATPKKDAGDVDA